MLRPSLLDDHIDRQRQTETVELAHGASQRCGFYFWLCVQTAYCEQQNNLFRALCVLTSVGLVRPFRRALLRFSLWSDALYSKLYYWSMSIILLLFLSPSTEDSIRPAKPSA